MPSAAFMAGLHPVAANILHHAVEFVLKGELSKTKDLKDLRNQLHKFEDLWKAFTIETAGSTLARFDPMVATLHSHWSLRHPDGVIENGMEVITTTHRGNLPPNFPSRSSGSLPAAIFV